MRVLGILLVLVLIQGCALTPKRDSFSRSEFSWICAQPDVVAISKLKKLSPSPGEGCVEFSNTIANDFYIRAWERSSMPKMP